MNEDLSLEVKDGIATLTMNRPERLNALSALILGGLLEILPKLAEDPAVGVVVITGAGRGFCAGGDVKGMAENQSSRQAASMETNIQELRKSMEVPRMLREMPKPTIAMIRGPVAGAGHSIALSCDFRIASDTMHFTTAFAKVGFSGDFGGSYFLSQLIGSAKAKELYFTSKAVKAEEALSLGIVNRVVPDGELEAETLAFAQTLASGPRVAYQYMKQYFQLFENGGSLKEALDLEAFGQIRTGMTEDHKEAAKAFVEKREPVFQGR